MPSGQSYDETRIGIHRGLRALMQQVVEEVDLWSSENTRQPWIGRTFFWYQRRLDRITKEMRGKSTGIAFTELFAQHLDEFSHRYGKVLHEETKAKVIALQAIYQRFQSEHSEDIRREKCTQDHSTDLEIIARTHTTKSGHTVSWIGAGQEEEDAPGRELVPDTRTKEQIEADIRTREFEEQQWQAARRARLEARQDWRLHSSYEEKAAKFLRIITRAPERDHEAELDRSRGRGRSRGYER